MYLLGKVGSAEQKKRFLEPLVSGRARSAFFMTEPADEGGAGSDPSMMQTTCKLDGNHWVINGRKKFITGAEGAKVGIVMAKSDDGRLPVPGRSAGSRDPQRCACWIRSTVRCPAGMPRSRSRTFRVSADQMLGASGDGFKYAQIRLSPARLSHCMRWLGLAIRANEIAPTTPAAATHSANRWSDHEGVGFMLAENLIDLKTVGTDDRLCAGVLDTGSLGTAESSMAKVAVSEALMRVADRCVQVMGGYGRLDRDDRRAGFREIRASVSMTADRSPQMVARQEDQARLESRASIERRRALTGLLLFAAQTGLGHLSSRASARLVPSQAVLRRA